MLSSPFLFNPTLFWWYFLVTLRNRSVNRNSGSSIPSAVTATATATTLPAGSSATANVTATGNNLDFSFGIPQGVAGEQGPAGTNGALTPTGTNGEYTLTATNGNTVTARLQPTAGGDGYEWQFTPNA